jgi:hypothetical protein
MNKFANSHAGTDEINGYGIELSNYEQVNHVCRNIVKQGLIRNKVSRFIWEDTSTVLDSQINVNQFSLHPLYLLVCIFSWYRTDILQTAFGDGVVSAQRTFTRPHTPSEPPGVAYVKLWLLLQQNLKQNCSGHICSKTLWTVLNFVAQVTVRVSIGMFQTAIEYGDNVVTTGCSPGHWISPIRCQQDTAMDLFAIRASSAY